MLFSKIVSIYCSCLSSSQYTELICHCTEKKRVWWCHPVDENKVLHTNHISSTGCLQWGENGQNFIAHDIHYMSYLLVFGTKGDIFIP